MSQNKKISQLDPLITSANDDVIAIVDTSESETKKQTKQNFLKEVQAQLDEHEGDTSNPHDVTASQTGAYSIDELNTILNALWEKETPSGLINGSNVIFTLSNQPIQKSLILILNRSVLIENLDYTLSGDTITMTSAIPVEYASLPFIAQYQKLIS